MEADGFSFIFIHIKVSFLITSFSINGDVPMNGNSEKKLDYRHPTEKIALYISLACLILILFIILKISVWLFIFLVGMAIALVKLNQAQFRGQCVMIKKDQLKEDIYDPAIIAADRLNLKMPDIFVKQDPYINAFAIGFLGKKSVVLNSKLVDVMDKDELIAILGHEFSHIRCNHTNWILITGSGEGLRIPIISDIMKFIFNIWLRRSEFTADRGAILASRNLKATTSALCKVAIGENLYKKLDIEIFINQENEKNLTAKLAQLLSGYPFFVKRIKAIGYFYSSKHYKEIVESGLPPDREVSAIFRDLILNITCVVNYCVKSLEKINYQKTIETLKQELERLKNEKNQKEELEGLESEREQDKSSK